MKFSPAYQPNLMWRCNGPSMNFTFLNQTREFGFTQLVDDRGAAVGDLDLDGDLDILVTPTNGKLRYYENNVARLGQGWVAVKAVGNTSAPHGLGVVAKYTDSLGYPHMRIIGADGPTASQHENRAYFTIGSEPAVDLIVTFPSGIGLTFPQVAPDTEVIAIAVHASESVPTASGWGMLAMILLLTAGGTLIFRGHGRARPGEAGGEM